LPGEHDLQEGEAMADLQAFARLSGADHGLVVLSTTRADGTVQSSLVNAGVLDHPVHGQGVVGAVVRGDSRKVVNLRARPHAALVAHSGWEWVTVEGTVELAGPDDDLVGLDAEGGRRLLRDVFTAAGGTHDDFDEYDRTMVEERRLAVLITPTRIYSNG
jgi:PPOX class probable F420-dependent enzyme